MKILRVVFVPVLIATFFTACSRDPNVRKQQYLDSGKRYFEKGKFREAEIEFSNAVKVDPNYAEGHYQLAEAYLKLQQAQAAYQELTRTIELQPENYQARIELANLLILGHDFQQAQLQTNLLLEKRPNDSAVHSTISGLLMAEGNLAPAIAEMEKAVALDPNRWDFRLQLALLQIRNNQFGLAETNFNKVIELNPQDIRPRVLLGTFYQSRRQFPEAEQQFQSAMALDPSSADPRAAMARLCVAEGRKPEAEQLLIQAKRDLPKNSAAYRLLGEFYFANGEIDKATAEYSSLHQQNPDDLQLKKNYIELLIQTKQFPEARKLDDEILKANSHDEDALIYQSQMQITDGDVNDAAQKLETVIKNNPKNAEGHYVLGVAYDKLGYLERAESEWREAMRLQPNMLDAVRALASAAMRQNDPATLEEASSQLIVLQPGSPDGYSLRALANINRKHYNESEQDIHQAIAIAPQSAYGYVQLGNLRLAQKQFPEAAKSYQDALNRNPDSTDALRGLMNAFVAQNQPDRAVAAANAQIAKSPANSGFYDLLGTTLFFGKKDFAGAESAFSKSVSLDKHNVDALLKLCQAQATRGQIDQAIASAKLGLHDNPRSADLNVLLGKLYESKSDWNQAEDAYRNALNINPQHPQASSNLAKLMLQTGGNLDVALSLAQTARRGLPGSPSAADTLAWIHYQRGAYQSAIGLLQEALNLQEKAHTPDSADIHYHLGMAYAKTGQTALARQQFERALKLNPNVNDAKKQLSQLKSL
ncbi:MAG: tetratricopeptide repeat protein [Terriglobales bacterium]